MCESGPSPGTAAEPRPAAAAARRSFPFRSALPPRTLRPQRAHSADRGSPKAAGHRRLAAPIYSPAGAATRPFEPRFPAAGPSPPRRTPGAGRCRRRAAGSGGSGRPAQPGQRAGIPPGGCAVAPQNPFLPFSSFPEGRLPPGCSREPGGFSKPSPRQRPSGPDPAAAGEGRAPRSGPGPVPT